MVDELMYISNDDPLCRSKRVVENVIIMISHV